MKRNESIILWLAISIGILLRMVDITFPDVLTDEAQFGLGASAAHPPLGMFLMKILMMVFGMNLWGLRLLSILLGIGCIALVYFIAREKVSKSTALYAACIASLFPSAILFSRLAFLTTPQLFFWLLTILFFLRVKKNPSPWQLIFLFLVAAAATFMKFQGLLVPGFLLLGRIIEKREKCVKDSITQILLLSLVPITLYDVTHPGVIASVLLYGGSDDMPGLIERLMLLFTTWWHILRFAIVLLPLSFFAIRKIGWELQSMFVMVLLQGFFFGSTHEYYVADLVVCSIPCGILIASKKPWIRMSSVMALSALVIMLVGPRSLFLSSFTEELYRKEGYWNTHAQTINNALKDQSEVVTVGDAGHHLRWYLTPKVLVGKDMDLSNRKGAYLLLEPSIEPPFTGGKDVYSDEQVRVILR